MFEPIMYEYYLDEQRQIMEDEINAIYNKDYLSNEDLKYLEELITNVKGI